MRSAAGAVRWLAAAALALAAGLTPGPAAAQADAEACGREVAERFEVELLRVEPGEIDGRAVLLVTVMTPGGTSNDAFQVNTLAVDCPSGELVPVFRQAPSGVRGGDAITGDDKVGIRPDAHRSRTWR